ncbi:hypothetical protein [Carboxylicivirga marina]|uniref:Uncharacterized protein n=2 Tax=Carboxylicivirga marina TaxID=2800988 RepID=A0ABS1HK20_9BACT|nr:hypothetical protein [Carboxylicivirga marina]MBK3517504.1 hypothetical protein [Carboxylicivirga marina]
MKKLLFLFLIAMAVNANAIQKTSKEDACKRVVDKIMHAWKEVCSLNEKQETALYTLLIERQSEIYDVRKANKGDKNKQQIEVDKIRSLYNPKIEKEVGEINMRLMDAYWNTQIGMDMNDLINAKV